MFSGRPDLGSTSADEVLAGQSAGVGFLSSSSDVPGEGAGVAVSKSVAVKRERTQHSRPAEGLERCVMHNEWEKGWLRCLFFVVFCSLVVWSLGVGRYWFSIIWLCSMIVFSWAQRGTPWRSVLVFFASVGLLTGCCAAGEVTESSRVALLDSS